MTVRHTADDSPCWHGSDTLELLSCREGGEVYDDHYPMPKPKDDDGEQ